jgi:hypothetical protein
MAYLDLRHMCSLKIQCNSSAAIKWWTLADGHKCDLLSINWFIIFWVRDFTALMHLGLNRPFVPHIKQRSPEAPLKFQMAPKLRECCSPNKAPDGLDASFLIILWVLVLIVEYIVHRLTLLTSCLVYNFIFENTCHFVHVLSTSSLSI